MHRLKTILLVAFGTLLVLLVVDSVVYPQWIEPLIKIDDRIAEKSVQYDELKAVEDQVQRAVKQYKQLVSRVGSLSIGEVETDLRERLNRLIEKHGLQDASTTPSRPKRDAKTDLTYLTITVKGQGTLQAAVEFLRDVTELPQLARVTNPAIYPASQSRKDRGPTQMNIRVPIEILIPPAHKKVKIKKEEVVQPESFVRHRERDYSPLWTGAPFTPEPDYKPLKADAGKDVNLRRPQSRKTSLNARVTGGDGQYTCKWEPSDGLEDPSDCKTNLDVSEPCDRTYVVTVTDGRGITATDTLRVVVKEERKPTVPVIVDDFKEVAPPVRRDKDGRYKQLVMVLETRGGADHVSEVMIENNKSRQTEYYSPGAEFDGGELVELRPTGALVRRKDGYFIYPIGGYLVEDINVEDSVADDFPSLKAAAQRIQEVEQKAAAEAAQKAAAEAAKHKTATETTPTKTGEADQKDAPPKPDATPMPAAGNQEGPTIGDKTVPETGKPVTSAEEPESKSNRPAVRKTTRSGTKQSGTHRPGVRRPGRTQVPRTGQAKPADTTEEKPGQPTQNKGRQPGKRRTFKPRVMDSKAGQESKPAGDQQGGSKTGKEEDEKAKKKDEDKDKNKDKDQDQGKDEQENKGKDAEDE